MANVIKTTNHLENKYRFYLIGSIVSYLSVFTFWMLHIPLKLPMITMPGFVISALSGAYFTKQFKIIRSGVKGERDTVNLLSFLPDDYYVFNDIKVQVDGRESEIDNVVVSPNGVSIVETKNHNGEIKGDIEDKYWTQHKIGQKGNPYQKKMYSPVKQVKTHAFRLNQFLKGNGLNVWINSAVYFANKNTIVDITNSENSNIPVFSYHDTDDLLAFVNKTKKKLSNEELNKIIILLKKAS